MRHEIWPFLLHYFPYSSTYEEREQIRNDRFIEYQNIRKARCVVFMFVLPTFFFYFVAFIQLASCQINACPLQANEMGSDQSAVRSWHCRLNTFFIEPDLFDNSVPFDNTTPIYLINLLTVRLQLHYFRIFRGQ